MGGYTTSTALLEALVDACVTHLFVNLGSDHPALTEALSKRRLEGKEELQIITAPHEFVGLCAAQGYFQATGEMQAILVHVDAGTLSMAGAIHNVSRARIPVLMIAGTSPVTDENEMTGSRNEFIHYIQDAVDQRSIVKDYTVYNHEIRTGKNAKQLVLRASQFSRSEPQGPSYLTASRECLEEKIEPYAVDANKWKPVVLGGLPHSSVELIGQALLKAKSPLVITTYLGRNEASVKELLNLCESTGMAVLEAIPAYMNFPHNHELYVGNHWSEGLKDSVLNTADFVLVLDCDVPWIKGVFKPAEDASIFHIDCDTIKVNMTLFHIGAELSCQADSKIALQQLNAYVERANIPAEIVQGRTTRCKKQHDLYISDILSKEIAPTNEFGITPHYALSRLRAFLDDDCIILSEGISNYRPIADVLMRSAPGSYFTSGATGLGWHGGAAVGVKLAKPSKTVVALTGDGSFLFSIPSTVHWMSMRYNAPFLTVILNNRGWKSPMLSAMAVHKNGYSSRVTSDQLNVTLDPPCDYGKIAVAAGAGYGISVKKSSDIDAAFIQALKTVRLGKSAVVDIWLPKFEVGDRVG